VADRLNDASELSRSAVAAASTPASSGPIARRRVMGSLALTGGPGHGRHDFIPPKPAAISPSPPLQQLGLLEPPANASFDLLEVGHGGEMFRELALPPRLVVGTRCSYFLAKDAGSRPR